MFIERVCLLGLGEVGAILAEDLLDTTSVTLRLWDKALDAEGSKAQQHWSKLSASNRVVRSDDAASAARGCQLVLSAVTADEAINAAESILPGLERQCWFVDLNSVSPGTKCQLGDLVETVGGRFVEASVMSPITPQRLASPILLGGPNAEAFAPVGNKLGFINMQAVSASLGVAAATKMCRSVIIKGVEALVTESLLAARHYGIDAAVLASLNNLLPRDDWPEYAHYLITRSLQHGSRRAAEMREVAKTVSEAGLTPWMSAACAERQDWSAQYKSLLEHQRLDDLLDAWRAQLENNC